jgi:hypothetical protein
MCLLSLSFYYETQCLKTLKSTYESLSPEGFSIDFTGDTVISSWKSRFLLLWWDDILGYWQFTTYINGAFLLI